jgi:hypothetical protein
MITFQNRFFLLITLLSFNFLFADPCAMPQNTISLDGGDVWYNVNTDIAGFQFEVDGTTVSGASGGDAASAGFTVSAGGSTVLGFSFTGATVSAGCGTLTSLSLNGEPYGLTGIVFSDTSGNVLMFLITNLQIVKVVYLIVLAYAMEQLKKIVLVFVMVFP